MFQLCICGNAGHSLLGNTGRVFLNLFPNRANTLINVSSTQQISSLALLNVQGNQLITQAVNSNSAVLDVSELASGIYLLQLNVGNNTTTRKVVVK